jgi:hypothetical protein
MSTKTSKKESKVPREKSPTLVLEVKDVSVMVKTGAPSMEVKIWEPEASILSWWEAPVVQE